MENQTPFFKLKKVEKAQLDIKSNTHKQTKKLAHSLVALMLFVLGMLIVYLIVRADAPEVKIQIETQ